MGCGAAEATGLGFVCFVIINPPPQQVAGTRVSRTQVQLPAAVPVQQVAAVGGVPYLSSYYILWRVGNF